MSLHINVQFPEFVFSPPLLRKYCGDSNPQKVMWTNYQWKPNLRKSVLNKKKRLAHQLQLFVPLYVVKCYTKFQPIPTETLPSTRTKTRVYRIYIAPKTVFPFPKWHHRAVSIRFLTLVVAPRPSIWIWHRRWEEEHSWPFRKQKRFGDDVTTWIGIGWHQWFQLRI